MAFAGAGSDGDRLQHLRAVLPCEVRVVAETHPLFGRLLAAKSFKRWNGVLLLVIDLPDGSPGTIRCDATDVLGVVESGPRSVLDAAGLTIVTSDPPGLPVGDAALTKFQRLANLRAMELDRAARPFVERDLGCTYRYLASHVIDCGVRDFAPSPRDRPL